VEHVDRAGVGAERLAALEREDEADAPVEPVEVGDRPHGRDLRCLADGATERGDRFDRPPQRRLGDVLDADVDRADLQLDAATLERRQPVSLEGPLLEPPVDELEQQVVVRVGDQGVAGGRASTVMRPSAPRRRAARPDPPR
jgi:hypothetical protein